MQCRDTRAWKRETRSTSRKTLRIAHNMTTWLGVIYTVCINVGLPHETDHCMPTLLVSCVHESHKTSNLSVYAIPSTAYFLCDVYSNDFSQPSCNRQDRRGEERTGQDRTGGTGHFNLTFQIACNWQPSQFLRCFVSSPWISPGASWAVLSQLEYGAYMHSHFTLRHFVCRSPLG